VLEADGVAVVQRLAVVERVGAGDGLCDEGRQEDRGEGQAEAVIADEARQD
jgi:hypothetical protein